MKNITLFLFFISSILSLNAFEKGVFLGPHFNYLNLQFDTSSNQEGYAGGITTGAWMDTCYFFSKLTFEGTWNASKIVGDPCNFSSTSEYFLQLELGKSFLCNCYCFRPYIGVGWDRFYDVQEPQTIALCYRFDKLFIPIGLYTQWNRCQEVFALQLEFRPDVWQNLDLLSVSLDLDWGYGFRAQFIYTRAIQTCFGCFYFSWVPFFDWNRFGKASEENSFGATLDIPSLTRWELGVRAILEYKF